jgi:hypothetical protein
VLFRTYQSCEGPLNCKIWEAARATSAEPTFFKPINIGKEQLFVDGGLGCNNPSLMVHDEAKALFGKARQIGCFVSIGAGQAGSVINIQPKPGLWQWLQPTKFIIEVLRTIAIDSKNTHQQMLMHYENLPNIYFRLDFKWEIQGIQLSELEKMDNVEAPTKEYLGRTEVNQHLALMIEQLSMT